MIIDRSAPVLLVLLLVKLPHVPSIKKKKDREKIMCVCVHACVCVRAYTCVMIVCVHVLQCIKCMCVPVYVECS